MKLLFICRILVMSLFITAQLVSATTPQVGQLEIVAELPIRPGNVSVSPDKRIFATVHPLDKASGLQLIEVTGFKTYRSWPSAEFQSDKFTRGDNRLDTPLGITQDGKGRLWLVDMGLNIGKTRIWAFDIGKGEMIKRIELPASVARKGSFIQDLVVDSQRGWIYLADINRPALLAVRIEDGYARRFEGHSSLQAEEAVQMRVDGELTQFGGAPARVGVNPISLSGDGKILYFGAMTGTNWYSVPTRLLREGLDVDISAGILEVGKKPISDGATTDRVGNHFFTNLNENGIDWLNTKGELRSLVRSQMLDWPDSVQFGSESWLYISVNQLHKTPSFTGKDDNGKAPYRIMRVWTGTPGTIRR